MVKSMSRSIHNYNTHVTGDNGRFECGIQILRHFFEKKQFDVYVLQCVTTKHLVECGETAS